MFENFSIFFETTAGQIVVSIVIVALFIVILLPSKGKKFDVSALTVCALMTALAMILSNLKLYDLPYGGSITAFSMLPIAACAYFFGVKKGVLAGVALGLINLLLSPYVIHPIQLLFDYPLAFGALGLGGIFWKSKHGLVKGYILGIIGRYVFCVFSGAIFFADYAPDGFSGLGWALFYNATYIATEGLLTVILISFPPVEKMFKNLKTRL